MSSIKTEKFPFKSRFSSLEELWITPSAYIVEIIIARQAQKENIVLSDKFWKNSNRWKRNFKTQILLANSLLKIYSVEAIINALKTFQGKKIYSLSAPWLDAIIRDEQEKIDKNKEKIKGVVLNTKEETIEEIKSEELRPSLPTKQSTISKLKDL